MKRVLWGIEAVLVLVLMLFLVNHLSNEWMIRQYEKNNYQVNNLSFLGFWQAYVPRYNLGNVYYQRGEYEKAVVEYDKALHANPPKKVDCLIRINEVLSMLATFDEDKVTVDTYEDSIAYLESLKEILCKKGCAAKTGDGGHNEDAQQLKNDIDACIARLGAKVSFIKNDENDEPLSGAALQILNDKEEILYEWVSDGNPYTQIRFEPGKTYIYREVKAPDGYVLAPDIKFTVNEDKTVTYGDTTTTLDKNEVIMKDTKDDQSSSSSNNQNDNNDGSSGQDQSSDDGGDEDQQLEQQLQDIQGQSQSERTDEINNANNNYKYYDGPSW